MDGTGVVMQRHCYSQDGNDLLQAIGLSLTEVDMSVDEDKVIHQGSFGTETWYGCSKHDNQPYPEGGQCPICEFEIMKLVAKERQIRKDDE